MNPPSQTKSASPSNAPKVPYNPTAIKDKAELGLGKMVKHRVFGHGEITKMNEDSIHITFDEGVKVLSILTCLDRGLLESRQS